MLRLLVILWLAVCWTRVSAAELDTISYESLVPAGSPCDTTSRERDRVTQPVERMANFVMVVSNKGHCEHHMGFKDANEIGEELIRQCQWGETNPEYSCHIVMVNEKWVAKASDFTYMPPARIRWNQRTHQVRQSSSMSFNQRADLLVQGKANHNVAFSNFDFSAALSPDEIPNYGVVEMTQYGRETEPMLNNPWQTETSSQIIRRLREKRGAIVVAPVRTIGYGFNPAHRMAIAFKLARQVERTTGWFVHDPIMVQHAFGPGVRSISAKDLLSFARQVGARALVIPQVGHDNQFNVFTRAQIAVLTGSAQTLRSPANLTQRRPFDPAKNLIEPFARWGSQIGSYLTGELAGQGVARRLRTPNPAVAGSEVSIPDSTLLARDNAATLPVIAQYQWLGSLVPESDPGLRSEMFARSLVLLSEAADKTSPLLKFFTARALAEIGGVPAAKALIAGVERPDHEAYLAFMLGQPVQMQAALERVKPSVQRSLLRADLSRLQQSVVRSDGTAWSALNALATQMPSWQLLIRNEVDTARITAKDPSQDWPRRCLLAMQFCPNQAIATVMDSLAVHQIIEPLAAVTSNEDAGRTMRYIADFDSVLTGHPIYEQAVLRASALIQRTSRDTGQLGRLAGRIGLAQNYLRTGLEFSDSPLLQPGKNYSVVMFPAHKYRRANDQDYPPVFSHGRIYQYSQSSQGAGLTDYFFFRMPEQNSRRAARTTASSSQQ